NKWVEGLVKGDKPLYNTISSIGAPGEVLLGSSVLGGIIHFDLDGSRPLYVQPENFLASMGGVRFIETKTLGKMGFFGKKLEYASFIGYGKIFLSCFGAPYVLELKENEQLAVNSDAVVAFSDNIRFSVGKSSKKGFLHSFILGKFFDFTFTGPGTVYLQTRNKNNVSSWLNPKLDTGELYAEY
ncbi:MAG: AIM24 family protein, partial [Rickettsiales bacterium]|nr:AIM24 family protein [Rickettsiales bacterium]